MQHSAIVFTRDQKVPLSDDDPDMEHSWKCVPVPPDADSIWVIVDSSKDYATGWCRRDRCIRHDVLTKPKAPAIEDHFLSTTTTEPPPAIAVPVKKKRRRRKTPSAQLTFDFWRKN
jgi:hypothetical protein